MCTAVAKGNLLGRTLDYNCSFGESLVILPKGYSFKLKYEGEIRAKTKIMGVCYKAGEIPLFYDGINESGVGICALNFPKYAVYRDREEKKLNLASFEVISYILSLASSLKEALRLIENLNITNDSFGDGLPTTPMHWIIADREESAVVEPLAFGVKITKNPVGALTNAPPLDYHLTRLSEIVALHPGEPENYLLWDKETKPYARGMGAIGLPGDFSSVSRFLRAVFVKENIIVGGEGEVESFFHIMSSVSVPRGCALSEEGEPVSTIYTSCADLSEGVYYLKAYDSSHNKKINFNMQNGNTPIYFRI